jgi:hypothetical protein
MTVEDLIRELRSYPADAEVQIDSTGVEHVTGTYRIHDEDPPVVALVVERT